MSSEKLRKPLTLAAVCLLLWVGLRYLLPVTVPFLIGGVIAALAEPGVRLLQGRLNWRRLPASGLCVSLTLLLLAGLVSLLVAAAVRELGAAAKLAPAVGQTVGQGMVVLEDFLVSLADRAPDNIRPVLIQTVLSTFQNGTALVNQVTQRIPGAVANLVGWLSRGALTVGTGVLAGFLISVRLPRIRAWIQKRLPDGWTGKVLPAARRVKRAFGGWLRAQLKLMVITWMVVAVGLLIVGIPYAPLWAALVALVDAVPVLGVGTVLIPWAVVCFLQSNVFQGVGLLIIYGCAWLIRSVMEPRLVGKSLGLDPLISLGAFYLGFKLWGIPGMILAPVAAALLKNLMESSFKNIL